MAYYAYNAVTRQLLSISEENLPVPEEGVVGELPDITALELQCNYAWDSETTSFNLRPQSRLISKLDYLNRFTENELVAIYTAAKTTVAVEIWLEKFRLAAEISLDDPKTIAGVNFLEQSGLISTGRAAEILA